MTKTGNKKKLYLVATCNYTRVYWLHSVCGQGDTNVQMPLQLENDLIKRE